MVVLDEDFGTGLTLVEGNGGVRLSPVSVPEHAPRDWRSQCERERARADAAEARAEELRWAEVAARSDGGSWKSRFKACRRRLSEAVEETKEAHRTARDVPSLQAEVARLETLLSEAGIASAFDTAGALRKENARLRKALAASKAREGATGPWPAPPRRRTVLEPSPDQKETVRSLRTELRRLDKEVVRRDKENVRLNTRLDQEKERTERIRETAKKLSSESLRLHREVRILGDSRGPRPVAVRRGFLAAPCPGGVQSREGEVEGPARQASGGRGDPVEAAVRRGRSTARGVKAITAPEDDDQRAAQEQRPSAQDRAEVGDPESGAGGSACQTSRDQEGTRVRACRASGGQEDVVEVAVRCRRRSPQGLRRSRRRKATIKSLSRENARLRKGAKTSRNRIETLEVQLERLRATGAVLSRALYGRKSEQQDKPRSERKRGQQHGAPGHGRTQRPGLEERTEEYNPPPDACVCGRCGQPYAPNGAEESTLVEIEVKAHKRVIRRSALAQGLRVRVVAHGSLGAPGAAAVPQDALRDQLLGALPVRALCLLPPPAPGCRVVLQPRGCRSRRGPWPTA